jgi:copper transporter 1
MLWNWNTVDVCLLARSWKIKSHAMFAGSCLGVVCLVLLLYLIRRLQKEYELYLLRIHVAVMAQNQQKVIPPYRMTIVQMTVRAALDACQLGLAFIIMLLAMYFNGYIYISIVIGGFLGSLLLGGFRIGAG